MKIYCTDTLQYIDRFFGKDLWVKMNYQSAVTIEDRYIRFIDKDNEYIFYNIIPAWLIDEPDGTVVPHVHKKYILDHTVDKYHFPLRLFSNYYQILQPIEVYTTDDLLDAAGVDNL